MTLTVHPGAARAHSASFYFVETIPARGTHDPAPLIGSGGYAKAWDDHWKAKEKRDRRRAELLATVRSSDEYKRLQRKLRMFHEHLLDDPKSWRVKEKIAEIEYQIEMMERL
jgi:hypothetical protein